MKITDMLTAAICLYHEARGESKEGQIAVAHVILNRMAKSGESVDAVVYKPFQFSWANRGARPPIKDYIALAACMQSVKDCLAERENGETMGGADHYFADYITAPPWAAKMTKIAKIGKHSFYRG